MFGTFPMSGVLFAIISKDTIQGNLKHAILWHNFRLDKVNGTFCFLVGVDLGKAEVSVSINSGLLIDTTQSLDGTYIEGIQDRKH